MNVGVKVREISTGSIGVIEKGNNQNGFFVNFGSRKNWKRYNEVEIIHNTISSGNKNVPLSSNTTTQAQQPQQSQQRPIIVNQHEQKQQSQQQLPTQQILKSVVQPPPTIPKPKVQSEDPGPRFGNFKFPTQNENNPKYSTLPSRQFFEVSSSPGDANGTFKRSPINQQQQQQPNGIHKLQSPSRPSIPSFEPPKTTTVVVQPTTNYNNNNNNNDQPPALAPVVPKRTTPPPPPPPIVNQQPPPLSQPQPQPIINQQTTLSQPQLQSIPNKTILQPTPKLNNLPPPPPNKSTTEQISKSPRNENGTLKGDMWNINFNELKFGNVIGSGKYGEVSLGYWLGTPVAIKRLLENNEETEVLVQRELQILKEIRHPNIVQFLGVSRKSNNNNTNTNDNSILLVTEFMDGGDLFDALIFGDVKMGWKSKLQVALDIACACTYLQARGILHRDLKSQNILLSSNKRAKLCDLGLARVFEERINKRYTCVGSDFWMAPEVSMGEGNYDYKIDVFSFGIVLVEIITEKIPDERYPQKRFAFDAPSFLKKVPPTCPPEFSKLTIDCTKSNPKERPTFNKILETIQNIFDSLPEDDEEEEIYE